MLVLVFNIQTVNIQYSVLKLQCLIFKPQNSIFRLLYFSYFHYLTNYEGANGGTKFLVNCYFFGQISVNYYFLGQFSVNC